jgi:hypothetical protein
VGSRKSKIPEKLFGGNRISPYICQTIKNNNKMKNNNRKMKNNNLKSQEKMKNIKDYTLLTLSAIALVAMTSCGNTTEEKLTSTNDEPTEVAAVAETNTSSSVWKETNYVDEFGDQTGESTVSALFMDGTFSNSAVSNEDLAVKLIQVDGGLLIQLYEYQSAPQAQFGYENSFGNITVKYEDGTTEKIEVFNAYQSGLFVSDDKPLYSRIMTEGTNQEIKMSIREDWFTDYGSGTYNFTIQTR